MMDRKEMVIETDLEERVKVKSDEELLGLAGIAAAYPLYRGITKK